MISIDEAQTLLQEVAGSCVGGELIEAAKSWAREHRLDYLGINVLAGNETARTLYEGRGFSEESVTLQMKL